MSDDGSFGVPVNLVPPAAFVFGSIIGSFLNVVILRRSVGGRSRCPACRQQLRWWELVPILSFTFLRGRCRRCHADISVQYPLVELTMGLLAMVLATPVPATLSEIAIIILEISMAAVLIVLFVIDLKTMLLPDLFVGLLLVLVLARIIVMTDFQFLLASFSSAALGAVVGTGFMLLLWLATRGRGIGLGDVKLMAPLGLLFGVGGTAALLFIAYLVGGAVAVYLLARGRATMKTAMPFGPFLCGAALLLLAAG